MRKALVSALVVLALGITSASEARAGFLGSFVGNSGFGSGDPIGGWINFAVYENTGGSGNWLTDLSVAVASVTGSTLTGSEGTVFFYEVVRDATASSLTLAYLNIPPGPGGGYDTIGALSDAVFTDSVNGAVTATGAGTRYIGADGGQGGTDVTGSLNGATPFTSTTSVVTPNGFSFAGDGTASFGFTINDFGNSENSTILALGISGFVGDVTTFAEAKGGLYGSPSLASATVPVANPEPGSFALLGIMMVGGAGGSWWRRRRNKGDGGQSNS